ncbi:MAG: polyphosphate polymerase domain-containing protein [Bacteroidaceae bacterium]|nr:polyphosphate polymerase domain-containing protein [Bacteroidaceae bacterium]
MKEVKLMNRTDTKYVVPLATLVDILKRSSDLYFVQTNTDGERMAAYHTIYMDTIDMHMYTIHETGRKTRQKIRMRTYLDTGETFLELKKKNNHGRTKKKRIVIPSINNVQENYEATDFLSSKSNYDMEQLIPTLENRFNRITLVNKSRTERLTIDTGLKFHNLRNNNTTDCDHIAIIELKRDGLSFSPMKDLLIRMHVHTMGFSKYCIGCAMTDRNLRQNNLKQKLRIVKRFRISTNQ